MYDYDPHCHIITIERNAKNERRLTKFAASGFACTIAGTQTRIIIATGDCLAGSLIRKIFPRSQETVCTYLDN